MENRVSLAGEVLRKSRAHFWSVVDDVEATPHDKELARREAFRAQWHFQALQEKVGGVRVTSRTFQVAEGHATYPQGAVPESAWKTVDAETYDFDANPVHITLYRWVTQ